MVQAAQNDAGEVDGLSEVAQQRALESDDIPPERKQNGKMYPIKQIPSNCQLGRRFRSSFYDPRR